jgi:hypothetical protein
MGRLCALGPKLLWGVLMTVTRWMDVIQRLLPDMPAFHLSDLWYRDTLSGKHRAVRGMVYAERARFQVGVGVRTVAFAAASALHTAVTPDSADWRLGAPCLMPTMRGASFGVFRRCASSTSARSNKGTQMGRCTNIGKRMHMSDNRTQELRG